MAGTPFTGKSGRVFAVTAILNATKWTATASGVDVETTNYESTNSQATGVTQLYEEGAIGKLSLEFDVSAIYMQEDLSPPRLVFGQVIGPIYLYINRVQGIGISMPLARITSVPIMSDVAGKVEYSFKGKAQGVFFLPNQPSGKNILPKGV